jgi:glycine cleavage system H lipoate-binding protein
MLFQEVIDNRWLMQVPPNHDVVTVGSTYSIVECSKTVCCIPPGADGTVVG